jgi:ribose 5-phosphate isomerase B
MGNKIAIAADHAGYRIKEVLKSLWPKHEFVDLGPASEASVDYPDFADLVCKEVLAGRAEFGVLICGSGQGMAIRANRFPAIRAALCWNAEVAELAREHNNANVLCLGARTMDTSQFPAIVDAFLRTPFAGGRHEKRVGKLSSPTR